MVRLYTRDSNGDLAEILEWTVEAKDILRKDGTFREPARSIITQRLHENMDIVIVHHDRNVKGIETRKWNKNQDILDTILF